jgi:hypothetical protein
MVVSGSGALLINESGSTHSKALCYKASSSTVLCKQASFITPHHALHYVEAVSLLDDDFTAESENVMRGQLY